MRQYYQLVREQGKYDIEYVLYEARKSSSGVQIAPAPFVLIGNHPDEIQDTLRCIMKDIKAYPPVNKDDCDIFHDQMWHEDDNSYVDEDWDSFEIESIGQFSYDES